MALQVKLDIQNYYLSWPADELPILMAHPALVFQDAHAGFTLAPETASNNMALFEAMLLKAGHSRLLLLPEYALPSAQLPRCHQLIADHLPANTVFMAGLDRIPAERWPEAYARAENAHRLALTAEANSPFLWVNAVAIWIHDGQRVHFFLQPKLEGAREERLSADMLRGSDVLYFRVGTATDRIWSFTQLVCYDLIIEDGNRPLVDELRERFREQPETRDTDLLVVLQANDAPGNHDFRLRAQDLVKYRGGLGEPKVGSVLFVNKALPKADPDGTSGFLFWCDLWPALPAGAPLENVHRVHRRRRLYDTELTYAGFRLNDPAVHYVHMKSPLHPPANVADADYLPRRGSLTIAEFCRRDAPSWQAPSALDHEVQLALRVADPKVALADLWRVDETDEACGALARAFLELCGKVTETGSYDRLCKVVAILLGTNVVPNPDEWGNAPGWEKAEERIALQRLIQCIYIISAGEVPLDWRMDGACPNKPLLGSVTGQGAHFSLTVLRGDGGDWARPVGAALSGFEDPWNLPEPHLYLLANCMAYCNAPERVNIRLLKRSGAGGMRNVASLSDDHKFGPRLGERPLVASGPPLYWYTYQALWNLLAHNAANWADFVARLKEVFQCLVA